VNEGSNATFSLVTTNIAPGFSLPYTISGVSAADITGGALTGTATIDATGKATITVPAAADKTTEGDETLTVTVQGQVASITIKDTSVNTNPVAANATGSTNEDGALTSTLPAATDADGNTVTYAKATNPANGTVTVSSTGSYTYTPTANYSGPDSFTYTVSDGQGGSNTYTVNLTVNAVNDAPVASAGTLSVVEDTATSGTLAATDVDNTTLTYIVVSQPSRGSMTLGANGAYTYTPAKDANGSDSFSFRASDGALSSNTATVSITVAAVNDAPAVALPLPDQSTLAGSAFAYTFPSNAFTDVD
jgi:VCBS repeat-containing protein